MFKTVVLVAVFVLAMVAGVVHGVDPSSESTLPGVEMAYGAEVIPTGLA